MCRGHRGWRGAGWLLVHHFIILKSVIVPRRQLVHTTVVLNISVIMYVLPSRLYNVQSIVTRAYYGCSTNEGKYLPIYAAGGLSL